jgi:hypothetical protein
MPFVFIIVGIVLLVSGVRGQSANLLTLLKGDLTGSNNFGYWIFSILVIGAIGYVQDLRQLSRAFLVLVIVVLVLEENKKTSGSGGLLQEFTSAFASITGKAS